MLPVGEQGKCLHLLDCVQVLHHSDLPCTRKTSHDEAVNVKENTRPKHLCLMMSGSQGCIFHPVGERGQLRLGDTAGGKRETHLAGAQLKWPHRLTEIFADWGIWCSQGCWKQGNTALKEKKKLACSNWSLQHSNVLLAKKKKKKNYKKSTCYPSKADWKWSSLLHEGEFVVTSKWAVGFQPAFVASQMSQCGVLRLWAGIAIRKRTLTSV